jgi:hypothetical protein
MPVPKNPGGIQDRPDPRDYKWAEVGAGLPVFDWAQGYDVENELAAALKTVNFKIPIKDQDGSSSCGGQAWAYYGAILEALSTGTFEERSAKFIYAQTFYPLGGSTGRDNAEVLRSQGVCREPLVPSYEAGLPPGEPFMIRPQDITDLARNDAKLARVMPYVNVQSNIDLIAQAVKANHGAILLVRGVNNGTWSSMFPQPPADGFGEWGHWIYAGKAKLINGKKYIGLLNSWGSDVGEAGWQWIGAEYMATTFSVWTHMFAPVVLPPSFHHTFSITLNYQDQSQEVKALQTALQLNGTFPKTITPTGYYGDITAKAVLDFQIKYQLDTLTELYALKGRIVGPKTRAKLNELY